MVQDTFTDKQGQERTVIAQTDDELRQAIKDTKAIKKPTYPNINVPVKKGHDLTEVQPDLSVKLVDGTGADEVKPGEDEAPLKETPTGDPVEAPVENPAPEGEPAPEETPQEPTDAPQ